MLKLWRIVYTDNKDGRWVVGIIAKDRLDAENLLRERLKFKFSISEASEQGAVDVITTLAMKDFIAKNEKIIREMLVLKPEKVDKPIKEKKSKPVKENKKDIPEEIENANAEYVFLKENGQIS